MMRPGELNKTLSDQNSARVYIDRVTGNYCHVVAHNAEEKTGIATVIDAKTNEVTAQGPVSISKLFSNVPTMHLTGEWKQYDCAGIKKIMFKENAFEAAINWPELEKSAEVIGYSDENQRPANPLKLIA